MLARVFRGATRPWGRPMGLAVAHFSGSTAGSASGSSKSQSPSSSTGQHQCLQAPTDDPLITSELLDLSKCFDHQIDLHNDLRIVKDVISPQEEELLANEATKLFKRRKYEKGHWDNIIVNYREMETTKWSAEAKAILDRVRKNPILPQDLVYFPMVHVIDLAPDGYIQPHVDSIKFSGRIVAGLCLLSDGIMRFKEEHGDNQIDMHIPRRCFYAMSGRVRYHYTHEVLGGDTMFKGTVPVKRGRRISLIFRDQLDDPYGNHPGRPTYGKEATSE